MFKFEELRVYQEALEFTDEIYTITSKFPREEMFGLTNQLRRSAVSIALNISEGTSRTKKDFCHFLDIARGSCYESVANLTISKKRTYLSEMDFKQAYAKCEMLSKMLSKLKSSLQLP